MNATDSAARSFAVKKSRVLYRAAFAAVFAAFALLVSLVPDMGLAPRALLYAGAAIFAIFALEIGRLSIGDAPGLIVSDEGIEVPRLANGVIPWLGIETIRRVRARGVAALSVAMTPEAARGLHRKGLWRFLRPGGRRVPISLDSLIGSPDAIVGEIESRWRVAHGFAASAPPAPTAAMAAARPRAVYVILAIIAAVYGCELLFPISVGQFGSPSVLTLAYDGGMLGERIVNEGEWWRFFTAPLLHASPTHILFNGIVLWIAGAALETMIGWRWMCGIFAISALCGAFASFAFLPLETVGVGASGAIMGLLAATLVMSFRMPSGPPRTNLQWRMGQTIVPALLPFFSARGSEAIDYFAHAGGTAAGALVAVILLLAWPRDRAQPRFGWSGAVAGAALFVVAAGALVPILQLRATS